MMLWDGKLDKSQITPEFLKRADGQLVWIRDDYLSMMGYAHGEPELYAFLEHVELVKRQARESGYEFSA